MTEIKGKYNTKGKHAGLPGRVHPQTGLPGRVHPQTGWGGARIAGNGKHMGPPTIIGSNPHAYQDYLDDETITALKLINKNRSLAIRILAKNSLS